MRASFSSSIKNPEDLASAILLKGRNVDLFGGRKSFGFQLVCSLILLLIGSLSSTNAAVTNAIAPGQMLSGSVTPPAQTNFYTFTGTSNEVIFLTAVPSAGLSNVLAMVLHLPDGTAVFARSILNFDELAAYRLTMSGTYTIGIFSDGRDETFGYTTTLLKIPGPNATDPGEGAYMLSPVEHRSARLLPGDLDAFGVEAIAGDTLDLSLQITSVGGDFPVLSVFGPDGNFIAANGGPTSARLVLRCVKQTGRYTVVIYDGRRNEAYDFYLAFNQFPVVPPSDGLNHYLAICDCTNQAVVRWETSAQPLGFILESSEAVDGSISPRWSQVTAPFQINEGRFYFTDSRTNGTRFYRLRKPE